MNKKLIPLICTIFIFCCYRTSGQSAVNVSTLTGAANVVIPIYNISRGQVSCPINLVYNSSGIKPKDVEGTAGMGWQLQVGGSVSRQVRGLPDDAYEDNALNKNLVGWMYNSAGVTNITNFNIANTGTGISCPNETTDINTINANFSYLADTEPDLFYINAPGLSCQLFFDTNHQKFVTVPYQDLIISYTTNTNSSSTGYKQITAFTITNSNGVKYMFSVPETVTQTAVSFLPVNFFKSTYNQYKNGITYFDSWYLQSMTDINGNGVMFSYTTPDQPRLSSDPVELYIGGATTPTFEYTINNSVTPQQLSSIRTVALNLTPQVFSFGWSVLPRGTGQPVITSIYGLGRYFQFSYNQAGFLPSGPPPNGGLPRYNLSFLTEFVDLGSVGGYSSGLNPVDYHFDYNGVTPDVYSYNGVGYGSTTLPDSSTTTVDYWGYYSRQNIGASTLLPTVFAVPTGSANQRYQIAASTVNSGYTYTLPGSNRAADPTVIATGALSKVTYALGGNTTITYEPNDFYDLTAGTTVPGGGIRVRQLVDYDGINTANNIVRNYSYVNPSPLPQVSSGKPVSLPVYAFTIPYSGAATGLSLWENATAVSAIDLSTEDHTVMYGYVKLSQTGAGSTLYQYKLPATNWDISATPICSSCATPDWFPTLNYAARTDCTATYGPVKNDIYGYPFAPNTNYDFERGLVQQVTSFNDAGTEVSESKYTYQRTGAPNVITAFKFDENTNGANTIKAYAKYNIFTSANELTASVTRKLFGSPVTTQSQSTTVNYTYGNAQHLLTQQQTVNSDNTTSTTNIKYVKDYNASGSADPNVIAIYNLQQLNFNAPVETYQQIQNGSTRVTGATLTSFSPFTINGTTLYLPSKQSKFFSSLGVSDFQPFAINSGVKSADSRYYPVANYTAYDNNGILQTADDANQNRGTIVTDHTSYLPVAVFKNASMGEFGFMDFDSALPTPSPAFTITGSSSVTVTGSHTGNAYGLSTAQTVSGTFNKNTQANNYVFSIWVSSAAAGTLNFTLTNNSTHQVLTYAKPYANTSGSWTYYEWKLPISTMNPAFTISFTSSANIGIDDILFYPESTEVSTTAYDANFRQIAATNTNGVSQYRAYDNWGREQYAYDQDKNIISKKTYITAADYQYFAGANFFNISGLQNIAGSYYPNGVITFTAGLTSTSGTTYSWDFGDTQTATTSSNVITHTYSTVGSFPVTLKINSPYFAQETAPSKTVVTSNNVDVNPNAGSAVTGAGIDDIDFYVGTTLTYHFTAAQISTGVTVPRGAYNVTVTTHGTRYVAHTGNGFNAIFLNTNATSTCQNNTGVNSFSFSAIDLSQCNAINIYLYPTSCP